MSKRAAKVFPSLPKKPRTNFFCSSPYSFRPDSTRAFTANHTSANRLCRSASLHEHGTLIRLNLANNHQVTLATKQNVLALLHMNAKLSVRIKIRKLLAQFQSRIRQTTYSAPV